MSDKTIAVVAVGHSGDHYSSTYAYELYPVTLLGTEYYSPHIHPYSYQSSSNNTRLYVLAPFDNTTVTVNGTDYALNAGGSRVFPATSELDILSNKPIYSVYVSDVIGRDPWAGISRHYQYAISLQPVSVVVEEVLLPSASSTSHGFPVTEVCVTSLSSNNHVTLRTSGVNRKTLTLNSGKRVYFHEGEIQNWNTSPLHVTAEGPIQVSFTVRGWWNGISESTWGNTIVGITSNHPPVLEAIADQTVRENTTLEFTVSATDPDSDALTFSAQRLPAGASLTETNANQARFSWTPDFGAAGSYSVTVKVTERDRSNPLSDQKLVRIHVVKALPDLIVDALTVNPIEVGLGELTSLSGQLRNQSAPLRDAFHAAFLLDGEVIADTLVDGIEPGEQIVFSTTIDPGAQGQHDVTFIADPADNIAEESEDNNEKHQTVLVVRGKLTVRPNPFTPNGDGYNDRVEFDLSKLGLSKPRLRIVSFDGREVWMGSGKDTSILTWEGLDQNGALQVPGVYLYVLSEGDEVLGSGYVVLAR